MRDRLPCLDENRAVLEGHRLEVTEKRSIVGAGEGEQEAIALRAGWCSGWVHGGLSSVVVMHLTRRGDSALGRPTPESVFAGSSAPAVPIDRL